MEYHINIIELKVEMARHSFNNETLANACGVHAVTISRLLNGGTPTYSLMCKISAALSITPERATDIFFSPNLRNTKDFTLQPPAPTTSA
jgi:transcriptional regulator with XRE-family HTH domain